MATRPAVAFGDAATDGPGFGVVHSAVENFSDAGSNVAVFFEELGKGRGVGMHHQVSVPLPSSGIFVAVGFVPVSIDEREGLQRGNWQ